MKRKVLYSYLLNREKDLVHAISQNEHPGLAIQFHSTLAKAVRAMEDDCYDGSNKRGPIVKITLESVSAKLKGGE